MRVLFVSPVTPARTGDGLAMRAGVALRALAELGEVTLVVTVDPGAPAPSTPDLLGDPFLGPLVRHVVVHTPGPSGPADAASWLADESRRARIARLAPVARSAATATPRAVGALAARIGHVAGAETFDVVHVLRLRSLLWAEPFLGPARSLVDLDDDEVVTTRMLGDPDEAAALGRLADELLPTVGTVAVASPDDVVPVRRHGNPNVICVPNAIDVPDAAPRRRGERGANRPMHLLFVGNLTYRPNIEAVAWLEAEILPHLVAVVDGAITVDVVGRLPGGRLPLGESPVLRMHGEVPDVAPFYADADVAVVPIRAGGGTRIKVLEAAAMGVPIVSTGLGAGGLGLVDGRHLLIADTADRFATACQHTFDDPEATVMRVAEARRVVELRYTTEAVIELLVSCLASEPGGIERR